MVVRGQGVADRARSDYDPLGIDVGGFRLFPQLTIDALATDNLRASNRNREADAYLVIAPDLRFTSNWARHDLSGRAWFTRSIHAAIPAEDVSQFGATTSAALDISRNSRIRIEASADRRVESRTSLASFQNTVTPVSYNILRGSVAASQIVDRLVLNATLAAEKRDFFAAVAADGSAIDQDFRDMRSITAGGSAQYEIRSGVGIVLSGQYEDSRFTGQPTAPGLGLVRDSNGYDLLLGLSLELTSLVFGQVQVGMIRRSYDDPRLQDVSGPSYRANLLWNVTPLTSLRLTGARSVEDASSTIFAGNTRSQVKLAVDHELFRYIIVSADTDFSRFTANGPGPRGNEFSIGAGARYLLNRRWVVSGRVDHRQRTSDTASLRFHATTVSVSTRFAF
nr:outer membrane beta-barrel protein [Polymorphobacter multimanifer]